MGAWQGLSGVRELLMTKMEAAGVDPARLLPAPAHIMATLLDEIHRRHGGMDGYLDSVGVDSALRARLRRVLTIPPA